MGQVTVEVNAKSYVVGCEDGQEGRLRELAAAVDGQVRQVSGQVGALGETRLLLMGALLMADELSEARTHLSHRTKEVSDLRQALAAAESGAAEAIAAAADRVESMIASLDPVRGVG